MQHATEKIQAFIHFVDQHITGDEKGQAQVFCDRLFRAFGHEGAFEAGCEMEWRIHVGKGTKFADLLWPKRVLIEMKKRGEKLWKHYIQARDYWMNLVKDRPRYIVLCNFDEFWIYDFDYQMNEPVDRVPLVDLAARYTALNFLFPEAKEPQFQNDLVAVTRLAADKVAHVFNMLVARKDSPVPREQSQRFILQCVVALFAEDRSTCCREGSSRKLLNDCKKPGGSAFDLLGGLFRQMATPKEAGGGRYRDVAYFNGGIFTIVEPVDLKIRELELLIDSAKENWAKVDPTIFGLSLREAWARKSVMR